MCACVCAHTHMWRGGMHSSCIWCALRIAVVVAVVVAAVAVVVAAVVAVRIAVVVVKIAVVAVAGLLEQIYRAEAEQLLFLSQVHRRCPRNGDPGEFWTYSLFPMRTGCCH